MPPLPALAQPDTSFWIVYDNWAPAYYFPLPDEWDDHYFNVRFTSVDSCKVIAVVFFFYKIPGDSLGTLPDVHVLAWSSGGILPNTPPNQALDSLVIPDDQVNVYPDSTFINLEAWNLHFAAGAKFHIGWEPFFTDTTDSALAILADDGIPSTTTSCEWWGGTHNAWGTIKDDWGVGRDFFIRVQVETYLGEKIWLKPDQPNDFRICGLYPNPFNPQTSIQFQLDRPDWVSLKAYDTSGRFVGEIARRFFPAGVHYVNWAPQGLSSGAYLIMMQSGSRQASIKAMLVR